MTSVKPSTFSDFFGEALRLQHFVVAEAQLKAVRAFDSVLKSIKHQPPSITFQSRRDIRRLSRTINHRPSPPSISQKGLYLWGPVGQGKTMLLDTFHAYLNTQMEPHKIVRTHFANFMVAIHQALHNQQQGEPPEPFLAALARIAGDKDGAKSTASGGSSNAEDAVERLASRIVDEGVSVILLDELQVTNISDAMIFKRLGEALMKLGTVFILTSNCPPDKLYEGGLNRSHFLPFIPVLEKACKVISLNSHRDFRALTSSTPAFHVPGRGLEQIKASLVASGSGWESNVALNCLHGRKINLVLYNAEQKYGVATFEELCLTPKAPSDYVGLAAHVKGGLWILDVPGLSIKDDGEACRRFISLIDILYERDIQVRIEAANTPLKLIRDLSDVVESYETLWQESQAKFHNFNSMWQHHFSTEEVKQWEWNAAFSLNDYKGLNLSSDTLKCLWRSFARKVITKAILKAYMSHHLIYAWVTSQKDPKVQAGLDFLFGSDARLNLALLAASETGGYALCPK